ncbi:ISAzo13-like element transposase-related protein [Nostoc sp.]|uniref:ISAzo13-like element transposase-related protein n=1 Tax=Nostoc sp. TaxID=1180 RepID=UPI003FA55695
MEVKYNLHWNGSKLTDVETMLSWAKSMTWKGLHPIVTFSQTVYQKGISLIKKAMKPIESRLQRNPLLPKWTNTCFFGSGVLSTPY